MPEFGSQSHAAHTVYIFDCPSFLGPAPCALYQVFVRFFVSSPGGYPRIALRTVYGLPYIKKAGGGDFLKMQHTP